MSALKVCPYVHTIFRKRVGNEGFCAQLVLLELYRMVSITENTYSSIDHGLQSGPMLAFLLWLSDFKTKTSFGFLIKKAGGKK